MASTTPPTATRTARRIAIRDRLPVSIDFYNNDITNVDDNCIEADGAAHNIRIFRNRCFNHGHRALSAQPVFGGPVYFIRNIVYHAPEGGALKTSSTPAGLVVYHNTLLAPVKPMLLAVSNLHFRNNLILGRSEMPKRSPWTRTPITRLGLQRIPPERRCRVLVPMEFAAVRHARIYPARWASSARSAGSARSEIREQRNFKTLQAFSDATGQDRHSVIVDYDVFQKASAPDRRSADAVQAGGFRFSASCRIGGGRCGGSSTERQRRFDRPRAGSRRARGRPPGPALRAKVVIPLL